MRKLLLRGYPVTALVRSDSPGIKSIPKAVRLVKGDLGEYNDLRKAMENVDKVKLAQFPKPSHLCRGQMNSCTISWESFVNTTCCILGKEVFRLRDNNIANTLSQASLQRQCTQCRSFTVHHQGHPSQLM